MSQNNKEKILNFVISGALNVTTGIIVQQFCIHALNYNTDMATCLAIGISVTNFTRDIKKNWFKIREDETTTVQELLSSINDMSKGKLSRENFLHLYSKNSEMKMVASKLGLEASHLTKIFETLKSQEKNQTKHEEKIQSSNNSNTPEREKEMNFFQK